MNSKKGLACSCSDLKNELIDVSYKHLYGKVPTSHIGKVCEYKD